VEVLHKASREPRIDLLHGSRAAGRQGMTGPHVASELARQRPGLRVLFTSGYLQ